MSNYPIVSVRSATPGEPPKLAELRGLHRDDKYAQVVYLHSRTSASILASRIIDLPATSGGEPS